MVCANAQAVIKVTVTIGTEPLIIYIVTTPADRNTCLTQRSENERRSDSKETFSDEFPRYRQKGILRTSEPLFSLCLTNFLSCQANLNQNFFQFKQSATMATNHQPKNARFNVGGIIHEVPISTIERYPNTMLARMVSSTWQKDPEKEIFVDRNGLRFQYIVDYMRDGAVDIPTSVSRAAMQKDFEYFGFENISLESGPGIIGAYQQIYLFEEKCTYDSIALLVVKSYASKLNAGAAASMGATEVCLDPDHHLLHRRMPETLYVDRLNKVLLPFGINCYKAVKNPVGYPEACLLLGLNAVGKDAPGS